MRRSLRLVQGPREPASPPVHLRVLPLRRPRDLVDGGGGDRRRGARPPSVLRRRAHHRDPRERGRDPMTERSTTMSRTTSNPRNLAARMGHWSASHWKTATFGWLALVVVAFGIGGMV